MKILVDKFNNEVVFGAYSIEYEENTTITKNETGDAALIFADMNSGNSFVAEIPELPADFCGRNYQYTGGALIKKQPAVQS